MTRPLIQRRIDELETMFKSALGDPNALHNLEVELSFRSVPRASALLSKVRKALGDCAVLSGATQQCELFNHGTTEAIEEPPLNEATNGTASPMSTPTMLFEEALKVLKISTITPWEAVEASRRQIVDRAHPNKISSLSEEKRRALKEEAQRANVAYVAVLKARSA